MDLLPVEESACYRGGPIPNQVIEPFRIRTHRTVDKAGRYRWYNGYALPERYGPGSVTVRLHGTAEDTARRFNRTENVRVIPPSDPYFPNLYARRNDAESINRGVVGGWLGRELARLARP